MIDRLIEIKLNAAMYSRLPFTFSYTEEVHGVAFHMLYGKHRTNVYYPNHMLSWMFNDNETDRSIIMILDNLNAGLRNDINNSSCN